MSSESRRALLIDFENKGKVFFKVQPYLTVSSYHLSQDPATSHHPHCYHCSLSYYHLGSQSSLILPFVLQLKPTHQQFCQYYLQNKSWISPLLSISAAGTLFFQTTTISIPECYNSLIYFHSPCTFSHFLHSTRVILLKCKWIISLPCLKPLTDFPLHLK